MTCKVGLTGGIASGKSTISALFEQLGVPVIDTDIISHQLMQPDQQGYINAIEHFGSDILDHDKRIDRNRLRQIVFNDPVQKQWLEQMLHPLIRSNALQQMQHHQHKAYVLLVVPLLFETGFNDLVDRVITIDCDETTQKRRLLERERRMNRQSDPSIVEKIIASQMSNQQRIERADFVIPNSDDTSRDDEVKKIHREILNTLGHSSC